jgi:hypothetical protein
MKLYRLVLTCVYATMSTYFNFERLEVFEKEKKWYNCFLQKSLRASPTAALYFGAVYVAASAL